jgi:N,N'-diacetylchitobiose phosphorylase
MQYGYFDDEAREYVITRPDTPASWSNYLGSTEYGAIITNNAGGYSFHKSAAQGRFLRLRFNSIPMDQPGRYIYLRDRDNGDYWSASWQPVGKPLDRYKSTCHHGTGYTVIESDYAGILSRTTYFVPLGQLFEYWWVHLTNTGDRPRRLSAFSYCEFSNNWDTGQDLVNLQYSLFIVKGEMRDGLLRIAINDNLTQEAASFIDNDQSRHSWMALAGAPVSGYDTSRAAFLGEYRSYHNPRVVEQGKCTGSHAYGDNACGVLQSDLELNPGESRDLLFMLGIGESGGFGSRSVTEFGTVERAARELQTLRQTYHSRLEALRVETPDPEFNSMINVWAPYNAQVSFNWSRSASLVYNGERDGLGFRDSVQDVLGILSADPDAARARLELMLTGQVASGGAIPVIKPFNHHPGAENPPADEHFRSDDCLWFFNAVPAYVAETGDEAFYHRVLPFADHGEATVLSHLRRAVEFNLERSGRHGLPCGLEADWNDCLKLGYHGESLFVAFQLYLALTVYAEVTAKFCQKEDSAWALDRRQTLYDSIQKYCWDGNWFIWAFGEDGTIYGTKDSAEGQVYLNTQVWSVISGAATVEQRVKALQTVYERLATPFGLMLSAPPFIKTSIEVMRAVLFNPGIKENAGIFNHTQGWGVMAECLQGNGDRAYEYYRAFMPAAYNTCAEIRQCEPYVQAQTTYASLSPRAGNARTTWLTGAATWAYFSATQYLLGIRPEAEGLRIDPCIPSTWAGFKAVRTFRGKNLEIEVQNPRGVCKGVVSMFLNAEPLDRNLLPVSKLKETNKVRVILG